MATKAEQRIATALSALINERHPVALAVEALRDKALDRAEEWAKNVVDGVCKELAAAGNDRSKCAAYPTDVHGYACILAVEKYELYRTLTRSRTGTHRPGEPDLADVDSALVAKFVRHSMEAAAVQYDAFVVKLCTKIGDCSSATLEGDHVWGHSFLHVAKKDGATETWKTKQIVNTSKFGNMFNQWPSRKVDRETAHGE